MRRMLRCTSVMLKRGPLRAVPTGRLPSKLGSARIGSPKGKAAQGFIEKKVASDVVSAAWLKAAVAGKRSNSAVESDAVPPSPVAAADTSRGDGESCKSTGSHFAAPVPSEEPLRAGAGKKVVGLLKEFLMGGDPYTPPRRRRSGPSL